MERVTGLLATAIGEDVCRSKSGRVGYGNWVKSVCQVETRPVERAVERVVERQQTETGE